MLLFVQRTLVVVCALGALCVLPLESYAQDSATLTGAVTDSTGAVLPGVTVEAASPALIDRIRTTVTDSGGLYRLVDLRPGVYTMTFTLTGFGTVKHEGLMLTSGFTATVNASLQVGDLSETVIVTGQTPVVDLQSVRQQTTLQRSTLDALPTTGRINHLGTMLPGATLLNAGNYSVGNLDERGQFGIHGSRPQDNAPVIGGMNQRAANGSGFLFNNLAFREVTVETSGMTAERSTGGVQMIMIPRDGGNTFSGTVNTLHTFPDWQSENVDEGLRAQGIPSGKSIKEYYDTGFGLGGPIRRNRLWFFGAFRQTSSQLYQQGIFFDADPDPLRYVEDRSRIIATDDTYSDYSVHLTWQAASKHRIVGSLSVQPVDALNLAVGQLPVNTPESVFRNKINPNILPLASWTFAASNRLLIEAGASSNVFSINVQRPTGVGPDAISVADIGRNLRFGSRALNLTFNGSYVVEPQEQHHQQASLSYVTGSHSFKVGFNHDLYIVGEAGRYTDTNQINQALSYTFQNGIPRQVTIWATPYGVESQGRLLAAYAQDQWTMQRLTLNLGVRLNNLNGSAPSQSLPAGVYAPARSFPAVEDSPNFWNLNPRLGAAYDLFGTGRTAVKVSLGRFNPYAFGQLDIGSTSPVAVNVPAQNQAQFTSRQWNDLNANVIPDCDLRNPLPNGECGPWSDQSFGQVRAGNTRYADDALDGFNNQFHNWQLSASVQHELMTNVAVNAGFYRTWYGNFVVTDNLAVTPDDFSEFCVTAPVDSRLPNEGGQRFCGLYNVAPAKFGQVDNLIRPADDFGDQREVYTGFDATVNARFAGDGVLSGGLSVGRTEYDTCFVVDSPQQARPEFCEIVTPWSAGTQLKFLVVYPLPWSLQASAIIQNLPGATIAATYVASNAEVQPSLGRPLAGGAQTVNVELMPVVSVSGAGLTSTEYRSRFNQIDLRLSRSFQIRGRGRLVGSFDLYNLTNANDALRVNTVYGPVALPPGQTRTWLDAQQIIGGRLVKAGMTFSF